MRKVALLFYLFPLTFHLIKERFGRIFFPLKKKEKKKLFFIFMRDVYLVTKFMFRKQVAEE